jgi:hypothetical protein
MVPVAERHAIGGVIRPACAEWGEVVGFEAGRDAAALAVDDGAAAVPVTGEDGATEAHLGGGPGPGAAPLPGAQVLVLGAAWLGAKPPAAEARAEQHQLGALTGWRITGSPP